MKKELKNVELSKIAGGMVTGAIIEIEDGRWSVTVELNSRVYTRVFPTKRDAEHWKKFAERIYEPVKPCPCCKHLYELKKNS